MNKAIQHNGTLNLGEYEYRQIQDSQLGRSNARVEAVRANASLPEGSWSVVDDAVYDTYESVARLVADLRGAGLVTETDIMQKFDHWNVVDQSGSASIDMDPETAEDESSLSYDMDGVPVPVIHDDFSLGFREGPADSEAVGESLDTLGATASTRFVTELIERTFIGDPDGEPFRVSDRGDAFALYGLTDHPDTNTASTDADWTVDASTVRDDFRRARKILKDDNNVRPGNTGYWAYVGTDFFDTLDDADPEGTGDMTVRDRVNNLSDIERIVELDFLDPKSLLMFRPTEDVVDVGIAADIQPVQWESPFRDNWKVYGSIYPRVKSSKSGQSGIVYMTA